MHGYRNYMYKYETPYDKHVFSFSFGGFAGRQYTGPRHMCIFIWYNFIQTFINGWSQLFCSEWLFANWADRSSKISAAPNISNFGYVHEYIYDVLPLNCCTPSQSVGMLLGCVLFHFIALVNSFPPGPNDRHFTDTSSNPQVSVPVHRPAVNRMERVCQRHGSDQTPTLLFESKTHESINWYGIANAVEEFLLSITSNSVIVLSSYMEYP